MSLSSYLSPLFTALFGPELSTPQWESSQWLAFTPLLFLLIWLSFRRARGASSKRQLPHATRLWTDADGVSTKPPLMRGRKTRGVFFSVGILLTLLALCRPQWGKIEEVSFDQQREIVIGLDLSQSMLADDIPPTRLERSKLLIGSLLDQLKGERVGLALFAGTAFLQSPLSADHEVLRDLLVDLDPSFLPQGGTRYETLLQTALEAFSQDGEADRFLVILSDGESHEENWRALLPKLRERDIHVLGLGVGTIEGSLVPGPTGGLLKDARGAAVLSRLQPSTLQALAKETKGFYREASVWVDIAQLVEQSVAQGAKGQFIDKRQSKLHDRFQLFLGPALLFLFLSYLWEFPVVCVARRLQVGGDDQPTRASKPSRKKNRPDFLEEASSPTPSLLILFALSSLLVSSQPAAAQPEAEALAAPTSLETLVGELANKENLQAEDYGTLAQESLAYASQPPATAQASLGGVIQDGLIAVNRGERLDPKALPWDELRKALLQLQEQEKQKQEQQSQDNQSGDESQEKQEGGGQQDGEQSESTDSEKGRSGQEDQAGEDGAEEEKQASQAGEGEGQEPQAKQSEEAGLGDLADDDDSEGEDKGQDEEPSPGEPEAEPEQTRMVGGRHDPQDEFANENPELAGTLGKLERVRDRDTPAVLFERMRDQDAQGKRTPEAEGKNW